MSKFFKSTWFKCISFLLALTVVLGGTLAILNDLLCVEDSERTARAIKKIYQTEVTDYEIKHDVSDAEKYPESLKYYEEDGSTLIGEISKVYKIGDDTLFQATGANGYKGGTITIWAKVVADQSGNKVIDKILVESYDKQTLMSKFDDGYAEKFYQDLQAINEEFFVANTGATYSAQAYNNAVKCISEYFKGEVK